MHKDCKRLCIRSTLRADRRQSSVTMTAPLESLNDPLPNGVLPFMVLQPRSAWPCACPNGGGTLLLCMRVCAASAVRPPAVSMCRRWAWWV
jgi:hypothetical protein